MKVLVNGGLNLSELDGWWAEAYSPEVGWAIGDGKEHGEHPAWDAIEAEALYALLERDITLEFYERDESGMPCKWLERIRESVARLTAEFSAGRAIREYTNSHYLPAASGYRERADKDSTLGVSLLQWQKDLGPRFKQVRFGTVSTNTHDGQHFFSAQVFPGDLHRDELQVELYAGPVQGGVPTVKTMAACKLCLDSPGAQTFFGPGIRTTFRK